MAAAGGGTTDDGVDAVRLLAEASHELRGGAARLALMAEALAEIGLTGPGDDLLQRRMQALAAEGRRVQALASAMLDVSRLASEGRRLEPAAVSLATAVADVLAGEPPPPGRHVEVRVPGHLQAWADPLALHQVLANLIGNAFEHGGPRVTVTGSTEDGRAVVTVADDGDGLPTGWVAGHGLGLRIASRLVTMLDGELRYDTGGSGGARFTVRLPTA